MAGREVGSSGFHIDKTYVKLVRYTADESGNRRAYTFTGRLLFCGDMEMANAAGLLYVTWMVTP